MKIALIIPSLRNLGPVIVVNELVKGLYNHPEVSDIHIYYFDEGDKDDNLFFPCSTKKIGFFEKLDLTYYDIIHSHGIRPDLFLAFQKLRNRKLTVISTMHCYIYPELAQTYNPVKAMIATPLWLLILRPFNKIVFLANAMKKHYAYFFKKSQLTYVHNYRDLGQINRYTITEKEKDELLTFKNGNLLLGTICKLTKRKGVYQLIELLSSDERYKLIIVGDGKEQKNLQELARIKGVSERCFFTGYKRNAIAYLPFIDVFCLASNSEGFGLVLLEAALFKKSIVCTNLPSFRELYSENEVTFFEYGNIASLNEAVIKAVKNQEDLGYNANQRTLETYNKDHFIRGYLDVYKELYQNGL